MTPAHRRAAAATIALTLAAAIVAGSAAQDDSSVHAGHHDHQKHNMAIGADGMVMNSNTDQLPRDCTKIGPDYEFTVEAGTGFASDNPGTVFGYSQHEFEVEPCSRVTVTLVNKDEIRHQWMVHGLPRYLYPGGMFHLEAAGGKSQTGTFIVPGDRRTYLVHCDIAQHMEKGMKGQLKVAGGSGDLWSIPGVSGDFIADSYVPKDSGWIAAAVAAALGLIMLLLVRAWRF